MKTAGRAWSLAAFLLAAVLSGTVPAFSGEAGFDKLEAAIRAARDEALVPPDENRAMANAIRGYLGTIDPYSSYITAREYASLHNAPAHYCGVGMDLIQGPGGILYCLPYAGSPAQRAGIASGDVLVSVNGVSVAQYPLLLLESLIRGEAGSTVALGVLSSGKVRTTAVQRAVIDRASAELSAGGKVRRIRIWRFDGNTLEQLKRCLADVEPGRPLVLDLRGNVGGDLKAAIACAELFLPEESLILTLEDRNGAPRVFRASGKTLADAPRLALWQDGFTASAAEVFCAALRDNGMAQSFGQTSFGKGVAQSIIPAGDRDFFVVTTGLLLGPLGTSFHHEGLRPDHYVSASREPVEQNYIRRTYEVFGIRP